MRAVSSQDRRLGLAWARPPDSATMRQARWSSSAMAAKYTGWGTALGSRVRENEVKRTAGGPRREASAQPAAAAFPDEPADHRRTGLRPLCPPPERDSILVTANLPFDEWTEVFGSERLTGALLDRLTHHVHILEMNGDSYRLKRSRENAASQSPGYSDYV